jgi:hypothetical protein
VLYLRSATRESRRRERCAYVSIRQHTSADESCTCGAQSESHVVVSAALHGACVSYAYVSVSYAYVSVRQHTSVCVSYCVSYAYVSVRQRIVRIRQRTSAALHGACVSYAYVSVRQHAYRTAYRSVRQRIVRIRQRTSAALRGACVSYAYVSVRQRTSAYVSIRQHTSACLRIVRRCGPHAARCSKTQSGRDCPGST